jgi:hypothetical protein
MAAPALPANNLQLLDKLRAVQNIHSVAFHTEATCIESARGLPVKSAVMLPGERVLVKTEDGQEIHALGGVDNAVFFDRGAGQDSVYGNVLAKLAVAAQVLQFKYDEYTIEMVDSGARFTVDHDTSKNLPLVMAVSMMTPTFFDLGMTVEGQKKTIHFNNISHGSRGTRLAHSGDKHIKDDFQKPMLMQSISGSFNIGHHHAIILSGYNNTPLHRFLEHRPVVMILDHVKKVINVVSVSLDQFTVQESITTIPLGVTAKSQEGTVQRMVVEIFPNSHTCNGYLSNFRDDGWASIARAEASLTGELQQEPVIAPAAGEVVENVAHDAVQAPAAAAAASSAAEVPTTMIGAGPVLVYSGAPENHHLTDLIRPAALIRAMTTHAVYMRSDISWMAHPDIHSSEPDLRDMNCVLGTEHFPSLLPMEGGSVLFASRGVPDLVDDQARVDAARAHVFNSERRAVFVLGKMKDACRRVATSQKINGLYIHQVADPGMVILKDMAKRRELLAAICTNAATAYAGPLSATIVVVFSQENNGAGGSSSASSAPSVSHPRWFWMDGHRQHGLVDRLPEFAEEITADIERNLESWLASSPGDDVEMIVDLRQEGVLFNGDKMSFTQFKERVAAMDLEELVRMEPAICDVVSQAQRIYDDDRLKIESVKMIALLESLKNRRLIDLSRKLAQSLSDEEDDGEERKGPEEEARIRKVVGDGIKAEIRNIRRSTSNLVQKLGLMVSKRKQSSMKFNLAQLQKRQTIANNVDRAKNMTMAEYEEMLDADCSQGGVLWLNLNTEAFHAALASISTGNFRNIVAERALCALIEHRARDSNIDAITTIALLDLSAAQRQDPARPQSQGALVSSLPVSAVTVNGLRNSSWYFPMLDRYMELADPTSVFWISEANLPNIATMRIISRSTASNAAAIRDLGLNINPSSGDLGWFLIYMAMGGIETLISRIANPAALAFSDTTCANIRCLLCWILTVAASGNTPLSFVWQLFSKNSRPELPKERWEWVVYGRLVRYAAYVCWNLDQLRQNVRGLLIRQLNKLAITATEPLRAEHTKKKQDLKAGHQLYLQRLHDEYYPGYARLVQRCKECREKGVRMTRQELEGFVELFAQFNNVRVRNGSIAQLTMHLKKNLHNKEYIDALIADINYRWDNYDKRVKITLYRYAKALATEIATGTYKSTVPRSRDRPDDQMPRSDAHDLLENRTLGDARKEALNCATVGAATGPIHNAENIAKLLSLLRTICQRLDGGEVVEPSALLEMATKIRQAAKAIFEGEAESARQWTPPFNPLPHLDDKNVPSSAPSSSSSSSSSVAPQQDGGVVALSRSAAAMRAILGDANWAVAGSLARAVEGSPAARLDALSQLAFGHQDDLLSLAKFAGLGDSPEALVERIEGLLERMVAGWNLPADQVEAEIIATLL